MTKDKPLLFDEESRARRTARECRLNDLACTFPRLRLVRWQGGWLDLSTLMDFAQGKAPSTSAYHAVRFILAVWSGGAEWDRKPFDVLAAMTVWDEEHRAAFLAWAAKPWWE